MKITLMTTYVFWNFLFLNFTFYGVCDLELKKFGPAMNFCFLMWVESLLWFRGLKYGVLHLVGF